MEIQLDIGEKLFPLKKKLHQLTGIFDHSLRANNFTSVREYPPFVNKMVTDFILLWLSAAIIVLGLFWTVIDGRNRRKIDHIPGPRMYPIIGNLLECLKIKRDFLQYLENNRRKYGPIFRLRFVDSNFVVISDPEFVKTLLTSGRNLHPPSVILIFKRWLGNGLSMSTGQEWHQRRRMVEPIFTNSKLKMLIPNVVGRCKRLCDDLDRFDGQEINLYSVMQDLIATIAHENILGIRLEDPRYKDVLSNYVELLYIMMQRIFRPWVWNDFLYSLTTNGSRENVLIKILPNITMQAILKKKLSNAQGKDDQKNQITFLDYLIERQKHDSNVSDEDIRVELDTLISAMMNTSGFALCVTLCFIATEGSVQDKIRKEIASVFTQPLLSKGAPVATLDQLAQLEYLESVIQESLRSSKFPPVIGRLITEEIRLGNHAIPVGTTVMIDANAIHHDEKCYSTPDCFNPEHFHDRTEVEQRSRYAYLPFGAGIRRCVGERFIMIVLKLVVAYVVQNFQLESSQSYKALMNSPGVRGLIRLNDNSGSFILRLKKINANK